MIIPNLQAVYFCNKERQVHRFWDLSKENPRFLVAQRWEWLLHLTTGISRLSAWRSISWQPKYTRFGLSTIVNKHGCGSRHLHIRACYCCWMKMLISQTACIKPDQNEIHYLSVHINQYHASTRIISMKSLNPIQRVYILRLSSIQFRIPDAQSYNLHLLKLLQAPFMPRASRAFWCVFTCFVAMDCLLWIWHTAISLFQQEVR